MVSQVYVETEIRQHPRTLLLLERMRQLPVIEIEHYGEAMRHIQRQAYHPCEWHG